MTALRTTWRGALASSAGLLPGLAARGLRAAGSGLRCTGAWVGTALLALMAACGGGGGGGEAPPPNPPLVGNFFPMAVGDLWIYRDEQGRAATVRATAEGQSGVRVLVDGPAGARSESIYLTSASAVRQVPVIGGDEVLQALGAVDLMRLPLRVGDSFVQLDRSLAAGVDIDGDGRDDPFTVRSDVLVVGVDRVVTPAGAFDGAAHLRTTLRVTVRLSSVGQSVTVDTTLDDWYAPDVGPVRSVQRMSAAGITEETTMTLSAYRVGARRSETTPQAPSSLNPAEGATIGQTSLLQVVFDEPIDAASAAGALSLRDAQGNPVAGSLAVGANSLGFSPTVPLASGRYTARIAPAVADVLGNALGTAREWTFTVDATGPQIVGVSPLIGATDVPRDTTITVRYDEPLVADSLNSTTVELHGGMVGPVPISVAIQGDTVTVTPLAPLERGVEYRLSIGTHGYGPRDPYGNFGSSGEVARFTTDFGRFGPQQPLQPAGGVEAVASGDVSGDGRADVVIAVGHDSDATRAMRLGVYRQQPDGRLGAVQWVDTRASYACRPTAVAIGDVNGDGRQDVVLAEFGCGIELFLQDGAGLLQPGPFLPTADSHLVRLADIDGDGRQDVVAVGWSGSAAQIWRQTAGGGLVAVAGPAIETQGWGQLAVGDLNGDGRADIAITSGQGDRGKALGVALQRSDGSWAPPVYAAGNRIGGLFPGVAIGDIDGDGRAELVAAIDEQRLGVWRVEAGVLTKVRDIAVAEGAAQTVLGDINGDGRLDLVVLRTMSGFPGLAVHLQQPDGATRPEVRYTAYGSYDAADTLALGDVNGDGRPDVLVGASVLLQRPVGLFAQGQPKPDRRTLLRRAAAVVSR